MEEPISSEDYKEFATMMRLVRMTSIRFSFKGKVSCRAALELFLFSGDFEEVMEGIWESKQFRIEHYETEIELIRKG